MKLYLKQMVINLGYHNERRKLIHSDAALEFGTQVELSHTEEACNNVYNFHKRQEVY